ncbi:MAG TPA: MFS transporter [Anaeromyxobacter sp.]|nr:MFS transporter [Anaeromyxobacter sp.]
MDPKLLLKSRRIATLSVLSAASGMPYGWVVSGTLQAFLVALGFTRSSIGLLSGVSLPWALKFLWSPLVDRYALRWPGRRRSWMIMAQLALAGTMGAVAAFAWRALAARSAGGMVPHAALLIGLLALTFAFFSATQDIAYDAYTVEVLHRDEQGPVSGLRILFYRLGMLLSSAAAIGASEWIPWPIVFLALGGIFVLFTLLVLAAPEPDRPAEPPRSLARAVVDPLRSYFSRSDAIPIALFLVFYKFGDNMGGTMVIPFLKDLCFSNAELGAALKTIGTIATISGSLLGGFLLSRMGLGRALWIFGVLQAGANVVYSGAALSRHVPLEFAQCASLPGVDAATRLWTYGAISAEYFAQGMATAAQAVLLLRVCDKRYSATQFALLSSLFGLGRWAAGLPSGFFVERMGYPAFFAMCATVMALPGFFFLHRIAPFAEREVRLAGDAAAHPQ